MSLSNNLVTMDGGIMEKDFLKTLVMATGLPENLIYKELNSIAIERGLNLQNLELEDLRSLLAFYLRKELLKAKKVYS
ncbi:MAG: hypothetical protein H6625_13675 [Bdellovibrionaceae bacterium]|nr:hypothetical protein [Pseudobdellovibrionaceae bacterium]